MTCDSIQKAITIIQHKLQSPVVANMGAASSYSVYQHRDYHDHDHERNTTADCNPNDSLTQIVFDHCQEWIKMAIEASRLYSYCAPPPASKCKSEIPI